MLMGDLVEIDSDGYLRVIDRTSDIIIRGGKNISAAAVEAEVLTHPRVALAARVAMPDPVFGERVCVCVELRGEGSITLAELTEHLTDRGVTREWFPARLIILDELPRSSGGKVAKSKLTADILTRIAGAFEDESAAEVRAGPAGVWPEGEGGTGAARRENERVENRSQGGNDT